MANRMSDDVRTAVEIALEAGQAVTAIAAAHGLSVQQVYKMRQELDALRAKLGIDPLPTIRPGPKVKPLTDVEHAIRAEYLRTGQRRPLARRHGVTLNRLTGILEAAPSAVAEWAKRQQEILNAAQPQE